MGASDEMGALGGKSPQPFGLLNCSEPAGMLEMGFLRFRLAPSSPSLTDGRFRKIGLVGYSVFIFV